MLAGLTQVFTGCLPTANDAQLNSQFFSRVQIIGTRGTGLGQFNKPRSVAVDAQDNLFVVDMTGRVQKFSPDGRFLLSWQMPQTDKGKPKGMCRDQKGNIVVLEPTENWSSNGASMAPTQVNWRSRARWRWTPKATSSSANTD
jgi:DNA-binding beta-propeller fold protein YncE